MVFSVVLCLGGFLAVCAGASACSSATPSSSAAASARATSQAPSVTAADAPATPASAALLGHISFPNSGSADAQPAFIRGVLLLHSFEYDDAITAFREAQRIDAGFALAYWGEAMCYNQTLWYNENVAQAREVLSRLGPTAAARQAKAPTAREKGYLDAVERLFGEGSKEARNRAYAERMAALSREFPDDDQAADLYALALLGTIADGTRNTDISLQAGRLAMGVLKKNPEDPGAAHYALHAFDDGEHAAMGLEAARLYAKIAPASSHALHMPSHVFLPLGMWDEAAKSDEASFAVSVERVKRLGLSMAEADFHSLSWLEYEYLQQGRFAKAREVIHTIEDALRSAGAAASPDAVHASPHPVESEIGRGFGEPSLKNELASTRARLIVDSGHWEELKGQGGFGNVDELFALGLASVHLGDEARAEAAFDGLQRAQSAAPDPENRRLAQVMAAEVAGVLNLARGERENGLGALAQAARFESTIPNPVARPYPIKPAGELYAEALLSTGDAPGAVKAFEAALQRTPRRAAGLIGLARAQEAAGQHAAAMKTARTFLDMWHAADAGRPELDQARQILKSSNP